MTVVNASSKNGSLGAIKCGELPKLHKNGLKLVHPLWRNAWNLEKCTCSKPSGTHFARTPTWGGANWDMCLTINFYLMRSHVIADWCDTKVISSLDVCWCHVQLLFMHVDISIIDNCLISVFVQYFTKWWVLLWVIQIDGWGPITPQTGSPTVSPARRGPLLGGRHYTQLGIPQVTHRLCVCERGREGGGEGERGREREREGGRAREGGRERVGGREGEVKRRVRRSTCKP